jgi:hypothetical protein
MWVGGMLRFVLLKIEFFPLAFGPQQESPLAWSSFLQYFKLLN